MQRALAHGEQRDQQQQAGGRQRDVEHQREDEGLRQRRRSEIVVAADRPVRAPAGPAWRRTGRPRTAGGSRTARTAGRRAAAGRDPGSARRTAAARTTAPPGSGRSAACRSARRTRGGQHALGQPVIVDRERCDSSWGQPDGCRGCAGRRAERDRGAVAPAGEKIARVAAEQVAGLAGSHDEQRAVEIGEIIDPSILRSVHRLKLFVGGPPRSIVVSSPGLGMESVRQRPQDRAAGAASDGRRPPDAPRPIATARDRRRSGA